MKTYIAALFGNRHPVIHAALVGTSGYNLAPTSSNVSGLMGAFDFNIGVNETGIA